MELPLSKQPRRIQTRVIDYFDAFTSYKNERTKAACTENAMQLMFQLSLSYYEMLFTDPRNLRWVFNSISDWRVFKLALEP